MTAGATLGPQQEASAGSSTRLVVAAAVRLVRRGSLVVSAVVGVLTAFVAAEYRSTFSSAFSASSLEALAQNPAIRTLFGPPVALDDPGGFTVWRTGTVVAVLVGVWGALAAPPLPPRHEHARPRAPAGRRRPAAGTCCWPVACSCRRSCACISSSCSWRRPCPESPGAWG